MRKPQRDFGAVYRNLSVIIGRKSRILRIKAGKAYFAK